MTLKQDLMDQEELCQFEKLNVWRTGFSVRCPNSSCIIYIKDDAKSLMLHSWIEAKRSSAVCLDCERELK